MAVDLMWVRDNYDVDKSRYIEKSEWQTAENDWNLGMISEEQYMAVLWAYLNGDLLPAYTTTAEHTLSIDLPSGAILRVDGVEII